MVIDAPPYGALWQVAASRCKRGAAASIHRSAGGRKQRALPRLASRDCGHGQIPSLLNLSPTSEL